MRKKLLKYVRDILHKIIGTEDRKRLAGNIFSLSILQGVNYILPIITFPYQVRVLGAEKYGLLAFASATISYFQILVNYGFSLTAPREIAMHREDKDKLSEIVSSVLQIELALFLFSALLLVLFVSFVGRLRQNAIIYYITFGTVFGQILFPVWFFQGMERMKYITIFNIIARTIFTALIFIVVKHETDYYKVPLLNTFGALIAGVSSLYVIRKSFEIKLKWQKKNILFLYAKESFSIFISSFAVNIYTRSTTFILGIFTNNIIVGYYAAADKIIQIVRQLLMPIFQSIYPYITNKINKERNNGILIIRRIAKYLGFATFLLSLIVLVGAPYMIHVLFGDQYRQSIILLQIMAFIPFITTIGNILGMQTMLPLGKKIAFRNIFIAGGLLNIALSIILIPKYQAIGAAIIVMVVELFITISMILYLRNIGIDMIRIKDD